VFAASPVTVLVVATGAAEVVGVDLGVDFGAAAELGAELGAEAPPDDPEDPEDPEEPDEEDEADELGAGCGCAPACAPAWVMVKLLFPLEAASGVLLCGFSPSSRTTPETVAVPVTIARRMKRPL
jgi:hypothetical protein